MHVGALVFRLTRVEHSVYVAPQTSQDAGNGAQVVEPSALGALAQDNRHSGVFTADFGEQQRFIDHALTHSGIGLLIVFQKAGELSRSKLLASQSLNQTARMFRVGARQRRQHPTSRPDREMALAHSIKDVVRQIIHQR